MIRYDKVDRADYFGATRVTKDGAAALPTLAGGTNTGGPAAWLDLSHQTDARAATLNLSSITS